MSSRKPRGPPISEIYKSLYNQGLKQKAQQYLKEFDEKTYEEIKFLNKLQNCEEKDKYIPNPAYMLPIDFNEKTHRIDAEISVLESQIKVLKLY